MRFVPLIPSSSSPLAWSAFRDVELRWDGPPHPAHANWEAAVRRGLGIHALHLPDLKWENQVLEMAMQALHPRFGADFLVIPAEAPVGRWATSKLLQTLEALLERTSGRGLKLALRPAKGSVRGLISLLKEVRGEAVGFCWDETVGDDLELISDRLYTAVGSESADYSALQRTGYRWNLAFDGNGDAAADTASLLQHLETLKRQFPAVTFPAEMPATALGRPIVVDESITFGAHWQRPSRGNA